MRSRLDHMDQEADLGRAQRRSARGAATVAGDSLRQSVALPLLERRLQDLPRPMLLRWPGGQAGPPQAGLRVTLHSRRQLLALLRGRIGDLADAHVRGELDIDGSMRNMMAVSFAGYVLLVLLLVPLWGNHGLWAALVGFFALRGVTLALRYPALERSAG